MLNLDKFTKILALAGSNIDGEALSALRKVRSMLTAAGLSFTDLAQSLKSVGHSPEVGQLRERLRQTETDLAHSRRETAHYKQRLIELEHDMARAPTRLEEPNLRRSRAEIEIKMRAIFGDTRLSTLPDRELSRRTGVSPQAVGNWRRRLAAERDASGRASQGANDGQKSRERRRPLF